MAQNELSITPPSPSPQAPAHSQCAPPTALATAAAVAASATTPPHPLLPKSAPKSPPISALEAPQKQLVSEQAPASPSPGGIRAALPLAYHSESPNQPQLSCSESAGTHNPHLSAALAGGGEAAEAEAAGGGQAGTIDVLGSEDDSHGRGLSQGVCDPGNAMQCDDRTVQEQEHEQEPPVIVSMSAATGCPFGKVRSSLGKRRRSDVEESISDATEEAAATLHAVDPTAAPLQVRSDSADGRGTEYTADPGSIKPKAVEATAEDPAAIDQSSPAHLAEVEALRLAYIELAEAEAEEQELIAKLPISDEERNHPDFDAQVWAQNVLDRHTRILHEYNDIRDVGLGLMGIIADGRGVPLREVIEEFGMGHDA
ncbi:MAG: hypothetical protein M1814_003530 [Vezdaea aestivalis]|nr:MAG: hypothetical protein M1814_003530 [Vezdaea aestivalis]